MNKIKKVANSVKNEIVTHRGKIVFCVTTAMFVGLIARNGIATEKFLIEKGIDPSEFWLTPEDYAEMKNS